MKPRLPTITLWERLFSWGPLLLLVFSVACGSGNTSQPGSQAGGTGSLGVFAGSCSSTMDCCGECFNYYGRPLTAAEAQQFADGGCGDYSKPCPLQSASGQPAWGTCTNPTGGVGVLDGLTAVDVWYPPTHTAAESVSNCARGGGTWSDGYNGQAPQGVAASPSADAGSGFSTAGGADTGTSGGGGGLPDGCNMPACYADLLAMCAPSGTCVIQQDVSTWDTNVCYANGVKIHSVTDATTGLLTLTVKNSHGICYSREQLTTVTTVANDGGSTPMTMTIRNPAGVVVGTVTSSSATNSVVTCTGSAPVTLNSACFSGDSGTCAKGGCTP